MVFNVLIKSDYNLGSKSFQTPEDQLKNAWKSLLTIIAVFSVPGNLTLLEADFMLYSDRLSASMQRCIVYIFYDMNKTLKRCVAAAEIENWNLVTVRAIAI